MINILQSIFQIPLKYAKSLISVKYILSYLHLKIRSFVYWGVIIILTVQMV